MSRLCTIVASERDFRRPRSNSARVRCGSLLLGWAKKQGASLVAFPAGYLCTAEESTEGVLAVAAPLLEDAQDKQLGIIVGVDTRDHTKTDKKISDGSIKDGTLPFFAVVWAPGLTEPRVWRQRSTTSTNWRDAPDNERHDVRTLQVDGRKVAVVLCGEAFSQDVRADVEAARPDVAVIIAHTAAGSRHGHALKAFRDRGVSCVRAVHALRGAWNALWIGAGRKAAVATELFPSQGSWAHGSVFDF